MKYTKYAILISIFINLAFLVPNVNFVSAKACGNDNDCGTYQKCVDVPQINIDPNIKTATKTCADLCPPNQEANYCPEQPKDKNYTCVNYTCIRLEEPLLPVPETQITSLDTYIKYIYQIALGVVGLMALLMLILGGVMYMTAAGNASQMDDAKGRINNAILGLILALAAYLILYTINPDLVRLTSIQLSYPPMPRVVLSCENNICKAKTIAFQDIAPDTKDTCGEVGTECPPSCKLVSASLEPNMVKAPANVSSITETVKGTIKLRGNCENNTDLIITSFESISKFSDFNPFIPDNKKKIGQQSIQNLSAAEFKAGFPYNMWTFDFTVGKVNKFYWFTVSLIEKWKDQKTNAERVYKEDITSTPVMVRKSAGASDTW